MDYIQIIELVAATLGVLYLVLEVKASMWLWRVGGLLPLFYIYISWQSKVYGNIIVNLYYLITSIWGWWLWARQGKTTEDEGVIRSFVRQQRKNRVLTLAALLGGVVALSCALLPLFAYLTDSPYPLLDSIATCCGFVGMWLLVLLDCLQCALLYALLLAGLLHHGRFFCRLYGSGHSGAYSLE